MKVLFYWRLEKVIIGDKDNKLSSAKPSKRSYLLSNFIINNYNVFFHTILYGVLKSKSRHIFLLCSRMNSGCYRNVETIIFRLHQILQGMAYRWFIENFGSSTACQGNQEVYLCLHLPSNVCFPLTCKYRTWIWLFNEWAPHVYISVFWIQILCNFKIAQLFCRVTCCYFCMSSIRSLSWWSKEIINNPLYTIVYAFYEV